METSSTPTLKSAETIVDGTGQTWTREEIQWLIIQVGSLTKAVNRLGLKNTTQLRQMNLKTPPEYVMERAKQDPNWIRDLIVRFDSKKKAAAHLNVSATHLMKVLQEINCQYRTCSPTQERAREVLTKFGSVEFTARVLETSVSEIKRILGDEWRQLKDGTKAGDTSIRTGQIAEAYTLKCREGHVISTDAAENHNNPGYDFIDDTFGKVNVKGSPVSASGSYVWEFHPKDDMDTLALVMMTTKKEPTSVVMVRKHDALSGQVPTGFRTRTSSEGKIAICYKTP